MLEGIARKIVQDVDEKIMSVFQASVAEKTVEKWALYHCWRMPFDIRATIALKGPFTTCILHDNSRNIIGIGTAKCSNDDEKKNSIGISISLWRALTAARDSKRLSADFFSKSKGDGTPESETRAATGAKSDSGNFSVGASLASALYSADTENPDDFIFNTPVKKPEVRIPKRDLWAKYVDDDNLIADLAFQPWADDFEFSGSWDPQDPKIRRYMARQKSTEDFVKKSMTDFESRVPGLAEKVCASEAKPAVNSPEDLLDVLETAWGILANASGGNWNEQNSGWRDAAYRFRDVYFNRISEARLAKRNLCNWGVEDCVTCHPERAECSPGLGCTPSSCKAVEENFKNPEEPQVSEDPHATKRKRSSGCGWGLEPKEKSSKISGPGASASIFKNPEEPRQQFASSIIASEVLCAREPARGTAAHGNHIQVCAPNCPACLMNSQRNW